MVDSRRMCTGIGTNSLIDHGRLVVVGRYHVFWDNLVIGRFCVVGLNDGQVILYYTDGLRYYTQVRTTEKTYSSSILLQSSPSWTSHL